jgi:NAD(P)-dependent dehydrogenase (short-subunit alcohol dehydrogenase family)
MARLSGRVAIVTGGASGIGRGIVELFVSEDASVVIADLQESRSRELVDALGPKAKYVRTDVGEERDVEALVSRVVEEHGRLDCMVNNAGIPGPNGSITDVPLDAVDAALRVLVRGVVLGMKYAGRLMRAQKSGSIISMASVAGVDTGFSNHIYSAAKAAVIHLTKSVAKELGESGVRVNCICPGGIATPLFGKSFGLPSEIAERTVEPLKRVLAGFQPIPRAGLPLDVAKAALFLASDDSAFINGDALMVDGGMAGGPRWSAVEAGIKKFRGAFGISD